MNEEIQGSNPNPDLSKSDDTFGSAENFFDALESEVNSAITDSEETQEPVTSEQPQDPVKATPEPTQSTENEVDWEKRYKDSTREAQKMTKELKDIEAYKPVLDAMKNDGALVEHVRDYFQGNVKEKTPQEQLKLPEDFVFDPHEAMTDTGSDSAKVMRNFMDTQVNRKIAKAQDVERRRAVALQKQTDKKVEAAAFKEKHKMSDDDFDSMMGQAKEHRMTLDDIHYLVNRDKANANIATNTKKDMLEQMKNVRDIPTSSAGVNSAKVEQKFEDEVFDALKGSDGDIENIFNS